MPDTAVKRAIGRSALVAGVLLAAGWLLVLVPGASIPLDALRTSIEESLSRSLGQVVSIEGPIAVRPTLGPSVLVQDLIIAAGNGGQGMHRLRAGQLKARLGLFSLLSGRPRLTHLEARDVTVYLERGDAGADLSPLLERLARLEFALHDLVFNYRGGETAPPLRVALEQLTGSIVPAQPLQLAIEGRLGTFPYSVDLVLPSPELLLQPAAEWPWQAGMELAGHRVQLQGTLQVEATGQSPLLRLDLQGGRRTVADAAVSAIEGKLLLHLGEARPQLDGELQLASIDAVHLAGLAARGVLPMGTAGPARGWLDGIDAAIVLDIDNIGNLPVAVRETRINLTLRDGQLSAPLGTVIAGVAFQGRLQFEAAAGQPVVALLLAATDVDVAALLQGTPVSAAVQGDIEHIGLQAAVPLSGRAGGVAADVQLENASLSYGHVPDGLPVAAELDELVVSVPAGAAMSMTAHGALAGAPLAIELTGGSLINLLQGAAWPVSLRTTGGGATLTAAGEWVAARDNSTARLNLEVSGERLGDLAPWFGMSACAATPYTLRGQLVLAKDVGRLQYIEARFGSTRMAGELDWSRDERVPLLHSVLHVDTLEPDDVAGLVPLMSYARTADRAKGIQLDMPILPRPAVIANADIALTVAQITHPLMDITGVSFAGRLRDGVFHPSPFQARFGSRLLQGQLDTSGVDAGVAFEISADEVAPGNLFDRLFSTAVQWVGNAGVVPLGWFFGQGLPLPVAQECAPGPGDAKGTDEH